MTSDWHHHPPIEPGTPVLAVCAGPGGLWAGGLGGAAWYSDAEGWTPLTAGLPLRSVTALAFGAGCLLAGGAGGIARSLDRGRSWLPCSVPDGVGTVSAIALSHGFEQDETALAATLDVGVLRSTDSGRSWQSSAFGLRSREVLALAWGAGETAVAATASGLHRSPNAGRAWRVSQGTEEFAFVALAALADGTALAAPEVGQLLRSTDHLASWSPAGGLPDDLRVSALLALVDGSVLLTSANHGLLSSSDGGTTWSAVVPLMALSLTADETRVYAGTSAGVSLSRDSGATWTDLPPAPLHDLRRLLIVDGVALVAGTNSPAVKAGADGAWTPLTSMPLPLTGLFAAPDRALLASTPAGLFRSGDGGATWAPVVEGGDGCVTQMTFLPGGRGWAGLTSDGSVLRTRDGGRTWERLAAPFGVLPLVAMQAIPEPAGGAAASVVAATYDDRQRAVAIWRSDDGGGRWTRGADAHTTWPVVATCGSPPLVTVGNLITARQPDGTWRQVIAGTTGFRRVVADERSVIALAADGVWHSPDQGKTWARDDAGLPADQIVDIAFDAGMLYVLLAGGQLRSRQL